MRAYYLREVSVTNRFFWTIEFGSGTSLQLRLIRGMPLKRDYINVTCIPRIRIWLPLSGKIHAD